MLVDECFDALFKIPENAVKKDIARARSDVKAVHEEEKLLREAAWEAKDFAAIAHCFHLRLCVASVIYERAPDETGLSLIALACEHVADDAAQIHFSKHLAHLDEDDDPKHDRTLNRIQETVLSTMLQRYGAADAAKLFEDDSKEFEIRREIGRRALASKPSKWDESADRRILKEHGQAVLDRVHARIAELRKKKA